MRRSPRIIVSAFVGVLLAGAGFVAGAQVQSRGEKQKAIEAARAEVVTNKNAPPSYLGKDVDFSQFWDIWSRVRDGYVHQPVHESQLFYGAIKGAVAALHDPYTEYFDPDEAAEFAKELEGKFEGIGAEIGFRDSKLIVVAPLPNSPAIKAGIKSGDQILEIDGKDTVGFALDEAVSKIRGPKDTEVKLTIYREGWKVPKEVTITRAQITVDSVTWKTVDVKGADAEKGVYGVITLSQFNEDTVPKFDAATRDLTLRGVKGIILDLRNDPGGYLDAAVEVVGGWVDHDIAVIERQSDGTENPFISKRAPKLGDIPTIVLANKGSASAAEIVTGALQDYGKATFVGEKTFGKGSVQNYESLADGSALKLTIAEWLTPKKRSIDKVGLDPDVEVKLTDEDANAGKDPQFAKAIELLNAKNGYAAETKKTK